MTKQNFGSKNVFFQKNLDTQKCGQKNLCGKKFDPKNGWYKNIWVKKVRNFGCQTGRIKILTPMFLSKKKLGSKHILSKND